MEWQKSASQLAHEFNNVKIERERQKFVTNEGLGRNKDKNKHENIPSLVKKMYFQSAINLKTRIKQYLRELLIPL